MNRLDDVENEQQTKGFHQMKVKKPADFNTCTNLLMPEVKYNKAVLKSIMLITPLPGLYSGAGALPSFGVKIGSFIGVSTSMNASSISGGFGMNQKKSVELDASLRFGIGLKAGVGLRFFI